MEADAVVGIGGIITTLFTSRKDEAAMKDAVLWTAARPLESKLYRFDFSTMLNNTNIY
jgi:hypothetical protein